jgi:hypothetical protein
MDSSLGASDTPELSRGGPFFIHSTTPDAVACVRASLMSDDRARDGLAKTMPSPMADPTPRTTQKPARNIGQQGSVISPHLL